MTCETIMNTKTGVPGPSRFKIPNTVKGRRTMNQVICRLEASGCECDTFVEHDKVVVVVTRPREE